MKSLFSPYRIKELELKNRIVMPALASFLTEEGGRVTEKTVEHYRRRAAGGPAMVMMEACAVAAEGIVSANQTRIYEDKDVTGLEKIARVIKSEGAVAAIQIHHAGRQTSPKTIGRNPLAPSPLPCPSIKADVEPLTREGIYKLVRQFGEAAIRARAAGFQLIEIHGAHGYLICQFLSGFSNIREDEYGGTVENRARFAVDIVGEIRKRLGDDFPVSFKISAQEFVPKGLVVDESISILRLLARAGIDIVQVSAGNDATPEWICQPMFMEKACLADSAAEIRQALGIPVMAVGRINDPVVADKIIAEGKADLVCIARGLIADPELPKKAAENRLGDIRNCIACNTCMQSIFRKGRIECLVNPSLARETEMEIRPAKKPRTVLVIGGGPAGMNTAWVAGRRGHSVHLYDRNPSLGGQLVLGSVPRYKREIRNLIRFQMKQAEKHGVQCHLGQEASAETVRKMDPDVVVVATGSLPADPPFEIQNKDMVVSLEVVLNGEALKQQPVAVVGGGASGCEIALHLAEAGSHVTLIEMRQKLGSDLEAITKKLMIRRLIENNVEILTDTRVSRVTEKGVWVIQGDATERLIETRRVVLAIGFRPDHHLYHEIRALGYEVHQIGDCVEPRNAKEAILEGAILGRTL